MIRTRTGRLIVCLILFIFCFEWIPTAAAAASNTTLTVIKVVGISLAAVEAVNLLVRLLKKIKIKKHPPREKKKKVIPGTERYKNLFAELTNIQQSTNAVTAGPATNLVLPGETNFISPITNIAAVRTNVPMTNALLTKLKSVMTQASLSNIAAYPSASNRSPEGTNRALISAFSNLSPIEQQDIMIFGWDHYYQVSLQYYAVKKYDKSREFMFHSIAIGMKVEEGTAFLKQKFGLTDRDIRQGVRRYSRSRE